MALMQDEIRTLQQQAITILCELIKKDIPNNYLGHTNFDPKREAEKVSLFIDTYVSTMAKKNY